MFWKPFDSRRRAAAWLMIVPALALPAAYRQNDPGLKQSGEIHFGEVRRLTQGGSNSEAYWSPDGSQLVFQATRDGFACDQIFQSSIERSPLQAELVSTGKGRTTCGYFLPDGRSILYSSTHWAEAACPPAPDRSRGYFWPIYKSYEIFVRADGKLTQLTDNHAYDAEATVHWPTGRIIFTSDRDGDLELYTMEADGSQVRRLTHTPGYDGGAFFSPDGSKIVWRASRPQGADLDAYRELLREGLVSGGKPLEIWVANADGSEARQITSLNASSFAPNFFPSGDRIIFSTNYGDRSGRNFELWAVNLDGRKLERVTFSGGFNGFPAFSPDGRYLAFSSTRAAAGPRDIDLYLAEWVDPLARADAPQATGR